MRPRPLIGRSWFSTSALGSFVIARAGVSRSGGERTGETAVPAEYFHRVEISLWESSLLGAASRSPSPSPERPASIAGPVRWTGFSSTVRTAAGLRAAFAFAFAVATRGAGEAAGAETGATLATVA